MKPLGYMLGGVAVVSWVAILAVASIPYVVARAVVRGPLLVAVLVCSLASCSVAHRIVTGRPATGATLALDFVLAAGALGASVHRYNAGDGASSAVLFTGAMAWGLSANLSEESSR